MFGYLIGFNELCSDCTPTLLRQFIDSVFNVFDTVIDVHPDVFKVCTATPIKQCSTWFQTNDILLKAVCYLCFELLFWLLFVLENWKKNNGSKLTLKRSPPTAPPLGLMSSPWFKNSSFLQVLYSDLFYDFFSDFRC